MTKNPGQFSVGHPGMGGRPVGARAQVTLRYLEAIQEVVNVDEWKEVTRKALADAKSERFIERQSGRMWLAKVLMPPDPAAFFQLHAPQLSITEIRAKLAEYRELRDELAGVIRREKGIEGGGQG